MSTSKGISKKALLLILDGYGIRENKNNNAVLNAKTPTLNNLFENYPFTTINASGEYVGLPDGVMGNSEVGHLNIGAGREVLQDLVKINRTIKENKLKDMPEMVELITKAKNKNNRVHLMGLLSDGSVHSHIDHIKAIITVLSQEKIEVFFHAFMDGRDTLKTSGIKFIESLNQLCDQFSFASIQGRFYAMDRDHRWDRVEKAYNNMTGRGDHSSISPEEYIKNEYKNEIYDEFITPTLFDDNGAIKDDDSIILINYRPDRAKEISLAFAQPSFNEFKTGVTPGHYVCMTPYFDESEIKLPILFNKDKATGGLSEHISKLGLKQLKIAETEKYAHVTYFFNGGEEISFEGEERVLIPSPQEVTTYDQKPEMSAILVTDRLVKEMDRDDLSFFVVNYANCDMVGHTGNYKAAIQAVEAVDQCVARLVKKCQERDIAILLTADHGNCDQMIYEDGAPHTAHTTSVVPACLIHEKVKNIKLDIPRSPLALKDIGYTILNIMGLDIPKNFSGESIFK